MGVVEFLTSSLFTLSLVYWICLGLGVVLVALSALIGGIFDFDAGGGPFTGPVVASWLTLFGGVGLLTRDVMGFTPLASTGTAALASVLGSSLFYLVFYKAVISQQGSTDYEPEKAVGMEAEVITAIPAEGPGEISFVTNSGRISGAARSADGKPIANGAIVRIERAGGGSFVVRQARPEDAGAPAAPGQAP